MDISQYVDSLIQLARSNPYIAGAAAIVLLIAVYLRPKLCLGVFFIGLLAVGVVYLILNASAAGVSQKKKLMKETTIPNQMTLIHDWNSKMPSLKVNIFD